MTRFAGAIWWRAATPPAEPTWPAVLDVLGPGALDCSPPDGGARLGLWGPGGASPGPRSLASSDAVTVLFAGYLRDLPQGCSSEAEYVLAHYRDGDWSWLRGANGVFAVAAIDHAERRCTLAVDRLGMRPLYCAADGAGVAFGTDLGAVAACRRPPREVDHDALQEMIAVGFPLGDRTALRGVDRVPPGSRLELGPGVRRHERYWSLADLPSPRPQSPEAFVDESRQLLREAIVRLARLGDPPPLCLLSTGYDSRRILLEGHDAGVRFQTLTAVWSHPRLPGTSIEPTVIEALCGRLGVPGCLVPAVEPADRDDLDGDRDLRDALLDFTVPGRDHVWAVPLLAELPLAPGRVNFDGIAGDTFFNNPFYALPRAVWGRWRADDDVLAAIAPEHRFWDGVWRGGLTSRPLADRVRDALDALPEGPARLSWFYLLGRTRRVPALLSFGLFDLRLESVCPYLDHDVIDHAWTFDPVLKGELRLQRVALDRHFPAFADLPSSHSEAAEVPARFRVATQVADPDAARRFGIGDVARILRAHRSAEPRAPARDALFAALSAIGLGSLGGGWREERLRRLLGALATVDHLGRADAARLARTRRQSLAWLARRLERPGRASIAL